MPAGGRPAGSPTRRWRAAAAGRPIVIRALATAMRQADRSLERKQGGLGLGLAITKRIVEQLDGTITVSSEIGKGTTFTMKFPVALRPVAVAAAAG